MREELIRVENGCFRREDEFYRFEISISRGECIGVYVDDHFTSGTAYLDLFKGGTHLERGRAFSCGRRVGPLELERWILQNARIVNWHRFHSQELTVRDFLLDFQRRQAMEHDVVMDGRDIGTVVLPHAGAKVFLTAAPEARARRRLLELKQRGQETELETVLRDIVQRDEQDRNRAVAPLRQAEDAVLLDTTELGLEESLKALISLVKGRLAQ